MIAIMKCAKGMKKCLTAIIFLYSVYIGVTSSSSNDTVAQSYDNLTDCGPVPNISHGVIQVRDDGNTSFGAEAYVICDGGYVASPDILICQDSGDWEDVDTFASCEPKDCGNIPNVTDGSVVLVDAANSSYGAMANVTCNTGYNASVETISCLESGNWEDNITCSLIDCGNAPNITDGFVVLFDAANSSYGAVANVTCNTGYNASVETISCLESGNWEDNITCSLIDCGIEPNITDGFVVLFNAANSSYGAMANVTCNNGYNASVETISCLESGNWEDNITCSIIDCGNVPNVTDGSVVLIDVANSSYGAMANVTCNNGYNASAETISCLESGNWEDNITCSLIDCGNVPNITDGFVVLFDAANSSYGAMANVTCNNGYNASVETISCLESGNWEDNITCSLIDCGNVPNVTDGSVVLVDTANSSYGAMANVTCNYGYNASVETISCLESGNWEDNITCSLIDCGNVPNVTDGSVVLIDVANTSYGAMANVTCNNGYNASVETISCLESGNWEDNITCSLIDCGNVPNVTDGSVVLIDVANSSYGAMANVTCNYGYNASVETISCLESGNWEDNITCSLIDCGIEPNITDGSVVLIDVANSSYGAMANVTCNNGYNASVETISCLESGNWEDNITCSLIDCGNVPNITDGFVVLFDAANSSYGAMANVTCNNGYNASVETISCLESGNWEDNITCSLIDCGNVPNVTDGSIVLADTANSSYGAMANVTCYTGYNASVETISCLESGNWEDNITCSLIDCGIEPNITDGFVVLFDAANSSYGAMANVTCDNGYNASVETISCLESGNWEDNITCSLIDCGNVPNVTDGSVVLIDVANSSYGAMANVTCNNGYNASVETISCLESGNWEDNITCSLIDCGNVPNVTDGSIVLVDSANSSYGALANVTCNYGYNASVKTISCLESGNWDDNITCSLIDCGNVPNVTDGSVVLVDAADSSYGAMANVTCNNGYNASVETISCLESGNWEDNITCSLIDCGNVPNVTDGSVVLIDVANSSYGAMANVTCNNGYNASVETISCLESGNWEDNITCSLIDCGNVPNITDGFVVLFDAANSSYGAIANVTCNTGYNASVETISCLESGNWEDNITCSLIDCGIEPNITDGFVVLFDAANSSYGAMANVTCYTGYNASVETISCLESGNWEDNITCSLIDCGNVPNVTDGSVVLIDVADSSYGAMANVTCNNGYNASVETISCLESGNWEDNITCSLIDCGIEPNITDGFVVLIDVANSSYGAMANVTCNTGYNASVETISCLESGNWEDNITCSPIDCGIEPNITDGFVVLFNAANSSYGAMANVTCYTGYNASVETISCLESGNWEDNITCSLIDCGNVPNVTDGSVVLIDVANSSYGAMANVMCNNGYNASVETISCLDSGNWEDNITCSLIDCGNVPNVTDGSVVLVDAAYSSYGAMANVTCNYGYNASVETISCLESGNWDDNITCSLIGCGEIPNIDHGEILLDDTTKTSYGVIAYVTCNNGYSASSSNITCLESGSWENVTCYITGCGTPPSIQHGTITLAGNSTSYGSVAYVTCNTSYIASAYNITCQETGVWENATCDMSDCGKVPNVSEGFVVLVDAANSSYGAVANVTCNIGYNASVEKISCLESGNWEDNITCSLIGCGEIPNIDHGEILLDDTTDTSYGIIANVTCNNGYSASSSNITCLESGSWENVTCNITGCGTPPSIQHGTITLVGSSTSYGSVAYVTCNTSYIASAYNITCQETGIWENATCDMSDCGKVPNVTEGFVVLVDAANSSYGAVANVTCNIGYNASVETISCLESGNWEDNITCSLIGCGEIPNIDHGEILLDDTTNTSYGVIANVTCNNGYSASSSNITCLESGSWENVTCNITGCGTPPSIQHGTITLVGSSTSYGSVAYVTCNTSYIASAYNITCQETGVWENATCDMSDCGKVPNVTEGFVVLVDAANSSYGAVANVTCNIGYNASVETISCLESGNWEDNITCSLIGCGEIPNIDHGEILLDDTTNTSYGVIANVTCNNGYSASSSYITCLESGSWENVTCNITGCSTPPSIQHGTITLAGNSTSYGSVAYVTCNTSYIASAYNITCQETGVWENATCDMSDCGKVPNVTEGFVVLVDATNSSYGAVANVTCNIGYNASVETISCLESGNWEDNITCSLIGCGEIPNIDHGEILLDDTTNTSYGVIANVTCNNGYSASSSNITCLESGSWENVTCNITGCGTPPSLQHGAITLAGNSTSYGSVAYVTCYTSYIASAYNITCQETGVWENATCDMSGCGEIPNIDHGEILLDDTTNTSYGVIANVTCKNGYSASSSNITCLESGSWENVTCNITGCSADPIIENAIVEEMDPGNTSVGALLLVTCYEGYKTSIHTVACLANGHWQNSTCSAIDCGGNVNNITNGEIELLDPNNTTYGALANVRCYSGFEAIPQTVSCLVTEKWENASCEPIGCGDIPVIQYGTVTLQDPLETSYGATAILQCDQGFETETSSFTCLETGDWDNVTCSPKDCGNVPSIDNGELVLVDANNSTFRATASVYCNIGYVAERAHITCLSSGVWDDNVTCSINGCPAVPVIANGIVEEVNPGNTSVGALLWVTCQEGFKTSIQTLICQANGQWENSTCYAIDCGVVVDNITNGEIELLDPNNTTYGAQANVRCNSGFEAIPQTLSCLETEKWDNASCEPIECGGLPIIQFGAVNLLDPLDTSYGATAILECDQGFETETSSFMCLETGVWDNVTCSPKDCGIVPSIDNGELVLVDANNSTFRATASVHCNIGYKADISHIKCLSSGVWDDNVTCSINECDVNDVPNVANGFVTVNVTVNQTTASSANVSCLYGFAATSPTIACLGQGVWQNNATCVLYDLGAVKVEAGQEIANGNHTAFLRCTYTIVEGLKYRIKWFFNGIEFYDTQLLDAVQANAFVVTDEMITEYLNSSLQSLFGSRLTCSATVFDGAGLTEHETGSSPEFVPLQVSTDYITLMRGQDATFTVYLNLPFGCPEEYCFLRYVLYDPYDSYRCYDSTIAAVSDDTCGGKVDGATPATISQVTTTYTITNITITTKNNRWYRLRSYFSLVFKLAAVGNSKVIWTTPSTGITVRVTENYYTRYRGCYSYVDPYMYTFDGRWYSNQLVEVFVLFRHKSLPIEVQTVTAYCNSWATCSCAVTVRAGGDVFTINHCYGHFTGYLSAKDGILRVYRTWSTSYLIILPTGMQVYVYVMPYLYYMMNVYVTPAPSDFEQVEGLCGNFNGDYSDDTILRDTNTLSSVENTVGHWWWWWWWTDYFYPHDFAYSWGLSGTGRYDENLLNPDVYNNVENWDIYKKLCVCPYASTDSNFQALCSANEEATCTSTVRRYGTLVGVSSRNKRDVGRSKGHENLSGGLVDRRISKMNKKWMEAKHNHMSRKRRDASNDTAASYNESRQMCEDQLNNDCAAYSNSENVSEVANSTDNLDNCARDAMIGNTTEWVTAHCDSFTQEVTVELDKDLDFAENNTELVENIRNSSCPGKCSGNGECIEGRCVCHPDFATDVCLLNITAAPLLEELADDGVCDVNIDPCDYITIVGNGFIDGAVCNITVYGAGENGTFILTQEFEVNCTYLNYNELLAPTFENETVSRRRRDVADTSNTTTQIATMIGVSVSNDGSHFGTSQLVVILDTTCQQTGTNDNNETIVTLKTGFCYIAGTCYTSGSYLTNSDCAKCDTSSNLFYWTDGCNEEDTSDNRYLIIILASVGSVILVGSIAVALIVYFQLKAKQSRIKPLVQTSLGPSKMRFWLRKGSVAVVEHHLNGSKGKNTAAAEYISDDE